MERALLSSSTAQPTECQGHTALSGAISSPLCKRWSVGCRLFSQGHRQGCRPRWPGPVGDCGFGEACMTQTIKKALDQITVPAEEKIGASRRDTVARVTLQQHISRSHRLRTALFDSEQRHQQCQGPVIGIWNPSRDSGEALRGIEVAKCEMPDSSYCVE